MCLMNLDIATIVTLHNRYTRPRDLAVVDIILDNYALNPKWKDHG